MCHKTFCCIFKKNPQKWDMSGYCSNPFSCHHHSPPVISCCSKIENGLTLLRLSWKLVGKTRRHYEFYNNFDNHMEMGDIQYIHEIQCINCPRIIACMVCLSRNWTHCCDVESALSTWRQQCFCQLAHITVCGTLFLFSPCCNAQIADIMQAVVYFQAYSYSWVIMALRCGGTMNCGSYLWHLELDIWCFISTGLFAPLWCWCGHLGNLYPKFEIFE